MAMPTDEHSERPKSGRARGAIIKVMVFFPPESSVPPLCSSVDMGNVSDDAAQTPLLAVAENLPPLGRGLVEQIEEQFRVYFAPFMPASRHHGRRRGEHLA